MVRRSTAWGSAEGLRVEGLHAAVEAAEVDAPAAFFELIEQLEVASGVAPVIPRYGEWAAEGPPRAFKELRQGQLAALRAG